MTSKENKKLFSPSTTKNKKKAILDKLFGFGDYQEIKEFLIDFKAFQISYNLGYDYLVKFYKENIDEPDILDTIQPKIVSSDFLREIIDSEKTWEIFWMLSDEGITEELKDVIYNAFETELETEISNLQFWDVVSYLSGNVHTKVADKLIQRTTNFSEIDSFKSMFTNPAISEEIREKIFEKNEEKLKQIISSENLDTLLGLLESEYITNVFADLIINTIVDKEMDEHKFKSLIDFFAKNATSEDIKQRLFSTNKDKLKEFIYQKDNDVLIELLSTTYNYKEIIDLIIDVLLNKKITIKDLIHLFDFSNISNETKETIFQRTKSGLELDISHFDIDSFVSLLSAKEDSFVRVKEAVEGRMGEIDLDLGRKLWSLMDQKLLETEKEKLFSDNKIKIEQMLLNLSNEQFEALIIANCLNDNMYSDAIDLIINVLIGKNIDINVIFTLLKNPSLSGDIKEKIYAAKETEISDSISKKNLYDFIVSSEFDDYVITMYRKVLLEIIKSLNDTFDTYDITQKDIIVSRVIRIKTLSLDDKFAFFNKTFGISKDKVDYFSNLISFYKGSPTKFINEFEKLKYFLDKNNIDINKFFQYLLGVNYDWLSDIISIVNNNQLDNFIKVKNNLFSKFYSQDLNVSKLISNFANVIKNYSRYPELLLDIANNHRKLTDEEKIQLEFLFNRNETLLGTDKPIFLEDCNKLKEIFKENCSKLLENAKTISELKEAISLLMFNDTLENMQEKLEIYGTPEELIKLRFNNRRHAEFQVDVDFMIILATMVEEIINCDDFERLKEIVKNMLENYENACNISQMFSSYNERMRSLYEKEANLNFTKINSEKLRQKVLDKERTERYGVDVYDFTDKAYCINIHVKSERETVEQLVKGYATGDRNFISCIPASYANILIFRNKHNEIIFGSGLIPTGNYIASSNYDMVSNLAISENSGEVDYIVRRQRGILETSLADNGDELATGQFKGGTTSEMLCYSEDYLFPYIILPGAREATEEELENARKYGLKFILTQPVRTRIENPIIIEEEIEATNDMESSDLETLKDFRCKLFKTTKSKPRRVALLTDSHALYEPTLAILEDARRNGIDEIYSLGDEVGAGPNPRETLELLERYGVQSVSGNHNDYVTKGIEEYREHLNGDAYSEAQRNSDWTRSKLTSAQIKNMQLYPGMIELSLGGEQILLCHTVKDLNNGCLRISSKEYSKVFEGHYHFKRKEGNVFALRGAGIGAEGDDVGKAYYVVLTENLDGGFDIEERYVPFDLTNVNNSINISDLPLEDKKKIEDWVQKGKTR